MNAPLNFPQPKGGNCTEEQYFSFKTLTCVPCSRCTHFEFVYKVCSQFSDVVCQPSFNYIDESTYRLSRNDSRKWLAFRQTSNISILPQRGDDGAEEELWQNLVYVSIAVLVFLVILVSIIVTYLWVKYRSRKHQVLRLNGHTGWNPAVGARLQSIRWVNLGNSTSQDYGVEDTVIPTNEKNRFLRQNFYQPQRRITDTQEDNVFESTSEISQISNDRLSLTRDSNEMEIISLMESDDGADAAESSVFLNVLHISESGNDGSSRNVDWFDTKLQIGIPKHVTHRRQSQSASNPDVTYKLNANRSAISDDDRVKSEPNICHSITQPCLHDPGESFRSVASTDDADCFDC